MEGYVCSQLMHDNVVLALERIQALIAVAMNSDLNELTGKTAYHFFCVIDEIILSAKAT